MLRRLIPIALVVATTAGFPAARAETRVETQNYVVAHDALLADCEALGTDHGIGGACFALDGRETSVRVEIDDLTGLPVGGAYGFLNGVGTSMGIGLFCGVGDIIVPEGAAEMRVYVTGPAFGLVSCATQGAVGAGTTGTITATYELRAEPKPFATDGERDCLQTTPAAYSARGITDDDQTIHVPVYVLLDGVSEERARGLFDVAARSYAPLGIDLDAAWFEEVTFDGNDAQALINQAKAMFGGQRPAGYDLVFTITSKDVTAINQQAVAGLADCVGGIRFPERAFAVGEIIGFEDIRFGPILTYHEATARTIAHEIGHLFGGQHHYANCVEDADGDVQNEELTPCSLMFNSLDTLGPDFDTLNGLVVRGHAVEFAAP